MKYFENFLKTNIMNNSCTVRKIIREIFPKKFPEETCYLYRRILSKIENRNFE